MKSQRFYGYSLFLLLAALSMLVCLARGGDAGFRRTRNLLPSELSRTMGADLIKLRNFQSFELARTMNADVIKLRNYEAFELKRTMDADVIKLRNYEAFELKRTMNADVIKLRNFQAFEMTLTINEYGISVSDIETTYQGTPQTVFIRGDMIEIHFNVTNTGDPSLYDGLVSVEILDPSEEVVLLNYFLDDIFHGMTEEYVVGYRVPYLSAIGTYQVRAMVLTDWPSAGGLGLAVQEGSFDVS